ncbi:MAG: aminotransferase class V-fold PLP-dependent enzyme, partial [Pseudomonadota bacterium]
QENPIQEWTALDRACVKNPCVMVDGVRHAPLQLTDIRAIGCDFYLFSLYKVYSVHQGLMIIKADRARELPNQGHFFNEGLPHYRLTPAGPDHAQVAASRGVLEYIQATDRHHGGDGTLRNAVQRVNHLWRTHEHDILTPLLTYLKNSPKARLIGSDRNQGRNPTVSIELGKPGAVCEKLGTHNIMAGHGHFYALRLIKALGIDPDDGVLRISLVHYNTSADVDKICTVLDNVL